MQLAVAAIAAGIDTLCREAGILPENVDSLYLAGGLGYHIPLEKASSLGMFCDILPERIHCVGNSCLNGLAKLSSAAVEDFISLTRVYFQSVIATNLGITNIRFLPDVANFKRLFKVPTQNGKLGLAEKSAARKMLMQDYGLNENFFKEIDSSVKRNCRTQNDIQSYLFMYQGFSNDLMMLMGNLMQWKFRFSMLVKKLLYNMTTKTVHDILTKSEWKDISVQKAAWSVRKYAEKLGYSEQWITDFVYLSLIHI